VWDIDLPAWRAVLEPVLGLCLLVVVVFLMRWTFSGGKSLISRPPRPGKEDEYGLLTPVHVPESAAEAERCRLRLAEEGITATVATTTDGIRLMVFPEDAERAREILR
jgi:hypothetical protein